MSEETSYPVRLYPDTRHYAGVGGVCLLIAFVFAYPTFSGALDRVTGSVISVVFAAAAVFLLINVLFRNKVYLQVDEEGLTVSTLSCRSRMRWEDIEGFFCCRRKGKTLSSYVSNCDTAIMRLDNMPPSRILYTI